MAKTSDALEILDVSIGNDPKLREEIERQEINLQIARMIYDARKAAGLSQKALAGLVQTKQPVFQQVVEDGDYVGRFFSVEGRPPPARRVRPVTTF